MKQVRLALVDLDGTLWRGGQVIPGATQFIERLRTGGIRPVYFTNNSSRTPAEVVATLREMGFQADESEVCTSSEAAAHVLTQRIPRGSIVTYIGQEGLREALLRAGFDARRAEGSQLQAAWVADASAAVVGSDRQVSYYDLAIVSRVAHRLGWFVLTNPDVRLPVEDGFLPGNGSVGALVATASGTTPIVTGKPERPFVEYALERYGATAEETVIIGDNLATDILAGNEAGIYSILVQTGVTPHVEAGGPEPDEIVGSVENIFRQ